MWLVGKCLCSGTIEQDSDHVQNGISWGIAQACHGKCTPLKKMKAGDRVVYYSTKMVFEDGSKKANQCQRFTAIGTVCDDDTPYQVEMTEDFKPWRIKVDFEQDVLEVAVKDLLDKLTFIKDKQHWGMAFRNGFRSLDESDFKIIEKAMLVNQ